MKNPFRSLLLAFSFLIAPLCAQDAPRIHPPSVSAVVIVKSSISQPKSILEGKVIVQGTEKVEGHIVSDARIQSIEQQRKKFIKVKPAPVPTLQRKKAVGSSNYVPLVRKEVIETFFVDQVHISPIEYFVEGLPRTLKPNQVIRGRFIRIESRIIRKGLTSRLTELPAYRFVSYRPEVIEIRKMKK